MVLDSRETDSVISETKSLYLYYMARQTTGAKITLPAKLVDQCMGQNKNVDSLRALTEKLVFYKQRSWAYKLAQAVDIDELEEESLRKILLCVFQKGESDLERILFVFHFCSHLCIRSLQEYERNIFFDLHHWITEYLAKNFSPWMEQLGGWEIVLNKSSTKNVKRSSIIGVCLCIIAVYIALNSRDQSDSAKR